MPSLNMASRLNGTWRGRGEQEGERQPRLPRLRGQETGVAKMAELHRNCEVQQALGGRGLGVEVK